jgi:hypothetical protein
VTFLPPSGRFTVPGALGGAARPLELPIAVSFVLVFLLTMGWFADVPAPSLGGVVAFGLAPFMAGVRGPWTGLEAVVGGEFLDGGGGGESAFLFDCANENNGMTIAANSKKNVFATYFKMKLGFMMSPSLLINPLRYPS